MARQAKVRTCCPAWHGLGSGLGRAVAWQRIVARRPWPPAQLQHSILAYLFPLVKRQNVCYGLPPGRPAHPLVPRGRDSRYVDAVPARRSV